MRKSREALGIGIEQQYRKRDWREPEGKAIQLRSGKNKERAGDDDKCSDEGGRKMAGGESAGAGARVGGVYGHVGKAVEGHGGGPSREHGNDDPEKLMRCGKAGSGEHGSAEREWESEDGVLPLDHLERDAEVVENGHREIVRQMRAAVSKWRSAIGSFQFVPCGWTQFNDGIRRAMRIAWCCAAAD